MQIVGAYEAKTHLPRLLEDVARGETITIAKHGVPVARLVPIGEALRPDRDASIDAWREFRRGTTLGPEVTIREFIQDGRR